MPEASTELTDEELAPDQPEDLRPEDADARSSDEFPKVALDTDIVNSSHEVEQVLDDDDVAGLDDEPQPGRGSEAVT